jgi:hypothetical protein
MGKRDRGEVGNEDLMAAVQEKNHIVKELIIIPRVIKYYMRNISYLHIGPIVQRSPCPRDRLECIAEQGHHVILSCPDVVGDAADSI